MSILGIPWSNEISPRDIESQTHESSQWTGCQKVTIVALTVFTASTLCLFGYGSYELYQGIAAKNLTVCLVGGMEMLSGTIGAIAGVVGITYSAK